MMYPVLGQPIAVPALLLQCVFTWFLLVLRGDKLHSTTFGTW